MKKLKMICLLLVMSTVACATKPSEEAKRIVRDGAKAKVTFHVTDSQKNAVTNVNVNIFFVFLDRTKNYSIESVTDSNGMCIVEGLCSTEIGARFSKEGYYASGFGHKFLNTYPTPNVKDGKWQPWNPTIGITLKEKRDTIPMYVKQAAIKLPKNGEPYGFDFKVGDLVKPHGKGEQADLNFMCAFKKKSEISGDYKVELFVSAVQEGEGIIVNRKENSEFRTTYEAQESGYDPQFYSVTDRTSSKILQQIELSRGEYLTFRSRIVRDDEGKIISSHYGKIIMDGTIDYGIDFNNPEGTRVGFIYYFNPTPNDRNLEYDGKNNLLNPRDPHYAP